MVREGGDLEMVFRMSGAGGERVPRRRGLADPVMEGLWAAGFVA